MTSTLSSLRRAAAVVALSAFACNAWSQDVAVEKGDFSPTWESLSHWECPEWFKNAKFGIWAHWGPQCEAEDGDWYARFMYYAGSGQYNYHVAHYGNPKDFGLKDLCNAWKAEKWNPDSLVAFYKSVGAKYFMTLGQHHDNFDLWNSPYQEWNSVNVGPHRDIVKGWSDACHKYGLPIGVSMHGSHAWTWLEPSQLYDGNLTKADGKGKWWDGLDPQELYAQRHEHSTGWQNSGTIHSQWSWGNGASLPDKAYKMKFQNRVLECINDYKPDMLYFDDTVLPFYGCDESVGLNILAHFYNKRLEQTGKSDVVVMGKILNDEQKNCLLWDVERGIPDRIQSKYWQTCTCIGQWHYDRNVYRNNGYKSAQQVVDMLVDIVSKNGNLLLSVPIRGNGTIDEKEVAILKDIKAWMDQNGKSIYGTRPWKTFGEGPLAEASKPLNAQGFNEGNNYSVDDVRYAERNDTLFATIMRWPATKKYTLKCLGYSSVYYSGKVNKVELLGYGSLNFENTIDGLVVTLPEKAVNDIAPVLQITFDASAPKQLSLQELIEQYESRLQELSAKASYNTGKYNPRRLTQFANLVDEAKDSVNLDAVSTRRVASRLNTAYRTWLKSAIVEGGAPQADGGKDITASTLVEAKNFSWTNGGTRFATPKNWTVENDSILQNTASVGVKNGIDRYNGTSALMLGVWNGDDKGTAKDITNARIYKKVKLEAGRYFFGAAYNTTYNMSDQAYIFAADSTCTTTDLPGQCIAYDQINKAASNGTFRGITFTLDKPQVLCLGFQANLHNGSDKQEFRATAVKLISYGVADDSTLTALVEKAGNSLEGIKPSVNTGFYGADAIETLNTAISNAKATLKKGNAALLPQAYEELLDAYQDFVANGKNPGGEPTTDLANDLTTEKLVEGSMFSRKDKSVTTRFAEPANWTVENFNIPNGSSGTKKGIDNYSGSDCLYLGIWNDAQANTQGSLANARIYRKVHLEAGRYYFGAKYNTTYSMSDNAYLFVAENTLSTKDIPQQSIAYYPINKAGEADGLWHGAFFTLPTAEDVVLGFQANLLQGSSTQETRVSDVTLLSNATATAIHAITNKAHTPTTYYSLSGAKLNSVLQKGVYIVKSQGRTKVVIR